MSLATGTVMEVRALSKDFRIPGAQVPLKAVSDVSLSVASGRVVAIVGESGSGKSTLGYCMSGHVLPTRGEVVIDGHSVNWTKARGVHVGVQMAFQDAFESMDPRWPIEQSLREASVAGDTGWDDVLAVIASVGIDGSVLKKPPAEVPIGTQKVLNLVRSVVAGARVIVTDEPTAGLDLLARRRLTGAVKRLATEGIALAVISHDMAFVEHISQYVYVMYLGKIVEEGTTEAIFSRPRHPYTMALVAASLRRKSVTLRGEIPSPAERGQGCPLASRCPFAVAKCLVEEQQLLGTESHRWACWKAEDVLLELASGVRGDRDEKVGL